MRTVLKALAVVLIICVFFPFFTVSCSNETLTYSGWDSAVGHPQMSGNSSQGTSSPMAFLLIVIPLAILIFSFVRGKGGPALALASSICGIVFLVLYRSEILRRVGEMGMGMGMVEVRMDWGYMVSIALYVIAAVVSAVAFATARNTGPAVRVST